MMIFKPRNRRKNTPIRQRSIKNPASNVSAPLENVRSDGQWAYSPKKKEKKI